MSITLTLTGPCPRRWSELSGDGATRFCGDCAKQVHHLDALSDEDILALKAANPTGFCAAFAGERDGVFRRTARVSTARRPQRSPPSWRRACSAARPDAGDGTGRRSASADHG